MKSRKQRLEELIAQTLKEYDAAVERGDYFTAKIDVVMERLRRAVRNIK